MSIVTVKNKFQVVIPQSVRGQVGVNVGDLLEATAEGGKIILKPKVLVDRDEYTPVQRRRIDAQLAKSLAEHKQGKSFGPFKTHQEMIDFLHQQTKQPRVRAARKSARGAAAPSRKSVTPRGRSVVRGLPKSSQHRIP